MGLIISYYLKPSSLQSLEDYKNSADENNDVTDEGVTDASDASDYYKLYIYVHNAETANDANFDLKNMYEESSKKHNANVNSYLNYKSLPIQTSRQAFFMIKIKYESLFIFPIIGQAGSIDIHDGTKNSCR